MWPFSKPTARQKEIRRTKAERLGTWYKRLPAGKAFLAILSTVATGVVAVAILTAGGEVLDLRAGQRVAQALTARVEFEVRDETQTEQERLRARDRSPNYYKLDASLLDMIRGRLAGVLTVVKAHADDPGAIVKAAAENKIVLDEAATRALRDYAAEGKARQYERIVEGVIARLRATPVVEPEPAGTRRTPDVAVLADAQEGRALRWRMSELRFSNDAAAVEKAVAAAVRAVPEPLRKSFEQSLLALLRADGQTPTYRPIYRFDAARTVSAMDAAMASVRPVVRRYAVGDILAGPGIITTDQLRLLQIEHDAYMRARAAAGRTWLRVLGHALLVFLVVFGVAGYMRRYQQGVFDNHFRRVVSMAVLLLLLGASRAVFVNTDAPPHVTIGLQALAAGLLGVVYADEAVFAICGALAILMTLAVQESIAFFVILLAVSGTMVFGLREVRNRGKIVLVGASAAVIAGLASLAVDLLEEQAPAFSLNESTWALGAVLMAGFVVEGVLPGIERLFKLSTGMTLLEWCDASKPLMRMMAADAPGTYNHSLLVGALAEAAAEAIGANGLLCRAGAYYHDIGKINKPEYFVENQREGVSRHERLSPAMSLLVIIGHVKDGIEMAREYGLPVSLHPFIAEHHGTTLVQYFYHAASQSRKPDDPEISESEFRYPGPKPQSRETAIVMLCDGVEGAVRAMPEPTPTRIEAVVGDIVQKRLADGQFDECDLTFRELNEIRKSLVKSLCGIYHSRIVYPEEEKKKSAS